MMKANKHMKNVMIAVAAVAFSSCNDYLDLVPKNDITTIETTFEKREDAEQWM